MRDEYNLPNTWYNPTKAEIKEIGSSVMAFDFDSTINNMGEPLGRYIAGMLECEEEDVRGYGPQGERTFHFQKDGVSDDTMAQLVHKFVMEESPSLLPTPWAIEVLSYIWMTIGQPITVITYRPADSAQVTWDWLFQNLYPGVPFNLIMLQGMQKDVVLRRLETEVFIDDRYKTVAMLENVVNLSVLFKRPWNQGRIVDAGDMTVNDLRGLIPIVNVLTRTHIMAWPGNIPYPHRLGYETEVDFYA